MPRTTSSISLRSSGKKVPSQTSERQIKKHLKNKNKKGIFQAGGRTVSYLCIHEDSCCHVGDWLKQSDDLFFCISWEFSWASWSQRQVDSSSPFVLACTPHTSYRTSFLQNVKKKINKHTQKKREVISFRWSSTNLIKKNEFYLILSLSLASRVGFIEEKQRKRKKVVMSAENKTKKKAKVKLLFLGTYQKLLKGTNICVIGRDYWDNIWLMVDFYFG